MTSQESVIEIVKGSPGGAYRRVLSPAQLVGESCVHCGKGEGLRPLGWVGEVQVRIHERCLGTFRGEGGRG